MFNIFGCFSSDNSSYVGCVLDASMMMTVVNSIDSFENSSKECRNLSATYTAMGNFKF